MRHFLLTIALAGTLGGAAHALPNAPDVIPANGGAIRITPIFHGSLQIEYAGKVIHVDPFSAGNYEGAKKADFVLISHTHPDHFDYPLIERNLYKNKLVIVSPLAVANKLKRVGIDLVTLKNGESRALKSLSGAKIEAVPMYNITRGPKSGQKFHSKGEFNGYILTLGGKRIYIAGDTEVTPEMKALKNIDIAFLPMNLPYTMTPQEAAAGARAFKPKIVYPYHYRAPFDKKNDNPQQFAKALAGSGIEVRLRGWYAHPAHQTKNTNG
ncbi:MAG TPA: MBL fold metallo-hydrolase [Abditibacterium sp.]|jgi:L-ascorbate metabolism protein UlaG (beta-lactamase superfamily)